jgi:hypothetical protein
MPSVLHLEVKDDLSFLEELEADLFREEQNKRPDASQ